MGGILIRLLDVPGREVWLVPASVPACFLLVDERAGGVLVNAPPFDANLVQAMGHVTEVRFIFLPSRFGAIDVAQWRSALNARTIAAAGECSAITGPVDEPIDGGVRIHGRLDFLSLSVLKAHADDDSYENRVIGALGLRGVAFEFAFCDNYSHGSSRFGPEASRAVAAGLAEALESEPK
jgi:hypothetical protein